MSATLPLAVRVPAMAAVSAGDVVVRPNDVGATPAFVVRRAPGPDQFGCATPGDASRLACAFGKATGVDVWQADRTGKLTAIARFRIVPAPDLEGVAQSTTGPESGPSPLAHAPSPGYS